jgi:formylglycine-generating enzyme required for sulfatase activity
MKHIRIFLLFGALISAVSCLIETQANVATPGAVFRDCPECPQMVVIPAGSFTMGSPASEKVWATQHSASAEAVSDEAPQHEVSLRSFALGKYDVTRAEYAAFVRDTKYAAGDGCFESSVPKANKIPNGSWENPSFKQRDRDPVTCVSWNDAQAYIAWLNGKARQSGSTSTNGSYRLPSEAEWEYAARAGTTTRFWWGDDDGKAADYAWFKNNSGRQTQHADSKPATAFSISENSSGGQTHPVGSKPANAFGLYDMAGNVWQWTQDLLRGNLRQRAKRWEGG